MKPIFLLMLTIFCAFNVMAQPWSGSVPGSIYYNQGNVGIGTTAPAAKLHINGTNLQYFIGGGSNWFGLNDVSGYSYLGWFTKYNGTSWENTHTSLKGVAIRGSNDIYFYTGDNAGGLGTATGLTTKMVIANNGNVGIGTTVPVTQLQLASAEDQRVVGGDYKNSIRLTNTYVPTLQSGGEMQFGVSVSTAGTSVISVIKGTYSKYSNPNVGGNLQFYTRNADGLGLFERMRILYNGYVGIGTNAVLAFDPEAPLHVVSASSAFPAVSGTTQTGLAIRLSTYASNGVLDIGCNAGSGNWIQSTNRSSLSTNYSLILNPNGGNVGIGILTPNNKLEVNGTIRAKEVKVESGWADYVFDQGYNLQDLSEVELYINEHKHLPEIPDAKEVEKDGVNLGEMNSLLLKKIEELTLYLIEQNKKISSLEKKMEFMTY